MQIFDPDIRTQLAQERHRQLALDYAARTARQASVARRRPRRRRLLAALRPRTA